MQKSLFTIFLLLFLYTVFAIDAGHQAQQRVTPPPKRLNWYKGNTHTHTVNSDGDSTPDEVVGWYRERNYNFLVLSDHNFLTNVEGLNVLHGADEKFIVIRGEEVSDTFEKKPIHVNGLNVERVVKPQGGGSVVEVIQRNVDAIRAARGVPHINHPNFGWKITADDLKKVENNKLFEIYNGHPEVNNFGGGGKPGLEEMWDAILSSGKLLYGIAVDDAHVFKKPWDKNVPRPGQGWIFVRAEELSGAAILDAMERGDFYASTGVELTDYQVSDKNITITINEERTSKYRVQFIGKNGRILSESLLSPAVYQFRGDELYVRAKIIESNGKIAWTQPVMRGGKN
ncbi:MAG TPA: CehA/McbA family metallohydrolase [Pyrinomonadaceae bacterium]|nr:CehA/McbA family metallohydrolase [Pyrinomonadaceae bacterium]